MLLLRPRILIALALFPTALSLGGCFMQEMQTLREVQVRQDQRIQDLSQQLNQKSHDYLDLQRETDDTVNGLRLELKRAQELSRESMAERGKREQELIETNAVLRRNLADVEEERTYYSKLSESLKTRAEQFQLNAETLQKQIATAAQEKTDIERQLAQANADLKKKSDETATLQVLLNKTNTELSDLKKQKVGGDTALADALKKHELARAEADKLKKEAADLRSKLAAADKPGAGKPLIDQELDDAHTLLRSALDKLGLLSGGQAQIVKDPVRGLAIRLSVDYLFLAGTMRLDPAAQPLLDQIAREVKRYPSKFIEVQGHTDTQPVVNFPFADNWGLAAERASKVVRYLQDNASVDPKRMKIVSCSQYRPVSTEKDTPASLDRRVEILITPIP